MRRNRIGIACLALAFFVGSLGCKVEVEDEGSHRHDRSTISTDGAPAAIGPYSQGIQSGELLFLSGQIGLDPSTGQLVEGGIEAETRRVMMNLEAVLEASGFAMVDVVQTQVFLADLADYAAMNEIYAEYFGESPPARAAVEVAGLPRGARVEIMMTARR